MSKGDDVRSGVSRRDEIEISLADVFAPLRRRWKLVVLGTGACWSVIPLVLLLTPPTYRCEASLSVPDAFPIPEAGGATRGNDAVPLVRDPLRWAPSKENRKVGIPAILYKKIAGTLSDGAVVMPAFAGKLSPRAVERLRIRISDHMAPMTSSGKDDIETLDKDASIAGILLSYESGSPDRSRDAVQTLAGLVRESLVSHVAADRMEWETVVSEENALSLGRNRAGLVSENRSLETLASDLERLARGAPGGGPAGRQVVDVRAGTHVFLSPGVQLDGVRARRAENEHSIRMYEHALAEHALRLRFFGRLRSRVAGRGTFVPEMPRVVGEEWQACLAEAGASSPAAQAVQPEVEALRERLTDLQARMPFVQAPTTWSKSRLPWAAAVGSMTLLFFVAAAFVADLWRRSGERSGSGGATAAGGI